MKKFAILPSRFPGLARFPGLLFGLSLSLFLAACDGGGNSDDASSSSVQCQGDGTEIAIQSFDLMGAGGTDAAFRIEAEASDGALKSATLAVDGVPKPLLDTSFVAADSVKIFKLRELPLDLAQFDCGTSHTARLTLKALDGCTVKEETSPFDAFTCTSSDSKDRSSSSAQPEWDFGSGSSLLAPAGQGVDLDEDGTADFTVSWVKLSGNVVTNRFKTDNGDKIRTIMAIETAGKPVLYPPFDPAASSVDGSSETFFMLETSSGKFYLICNLEVTPQNATVSLKVWPASKT
jgi:hypothetical protein